MKYFVKQLTLWLLVAALLILGSFTFLLSININPFDFINKNTIGVIIGLIGIPIGACITFCAAKKYYLKTVKDMERQTNASRIVNNTMASFLEITLGNGKTLFHRDSKGNIDGLEISAVDQLILTTDEQSQKKE